MKKKITKERVKSIGWLLLGIAGVIAYRDLPDWWHLLAWIPIIVGLSNYYRKSTLNPR